MWRQLFEAQYSGSREGPKACIRSLRLEQLDVGEMISGAEICKTHCLINSTRQFHAEILLGIFKKEISEFVSNIL